MNRSKTNFNFQINKDLGTLVYHMQNKEIILAQILPKLLIHHHFRKSTRIKRISIQKKGNQKWKYSYNTGKYEINQKYSLYQKRKNKFAYLMGEITCIPHKFNFLREIQQKFLIPKNYRCIWMPHLKNQHSDIIGEHAFRNPIIIFHSSSIQVAFLPLFSCTSRISPLRQFLDYQIEQGKYTFSYGWVAQKSYSHVFFTRKSQSKIIYPRKVSDFQLSFMLIAFQGTIFHFLADLSEFTNQMYLQSQFKDQAIGFKSLQWQSMLQKFHSKEISPIFHYEAPLLTQPIQNFIELCFDRYFTKYNGWHEFKIKDNLVGGMSMRSFTGRSRGKYIQANSIQIFDKLKQDNQSEWKLSYKMLHRWYQRPWMYWIIRFLLKFIVIKFPLYIWNTAWFLQVRTAFGLAYWGKMLNRLDYCEKARKMRNLLIHSPMENGCFPGICFPSVPKGTKWINSAKAFLFSDQYHTTDMALALYWLLKLESQLDRSITRETLQKCQKTARMFIKAQLPTGAIPAFIDRNGKSQDPHLTASAESGAIGMFLLELYKYDPQPRYIQCIRQIAIFLEKSIIPSNAWQDFETLYSCPMLNKLYPYFNDKFGLVAQNNLCISWAIEMYHLFYKHTQDHHYFQIWMYLLDYLSLFQQVWSPEFLDVHVAGGFGCMNIDGEWSDIREVCFSRLYFESYLVSGRKDHLIRGLGALGAGFPLILTESNLSIAPGNFRLMSEKDYGIMFENYGHQGWNAGTVALTTIDWGIGTLFALAGYIRQLMGDLFIDFQEKILILINAGSLREVKFQSQGVDIAVELSSSWKKIPFSVHCHNLLNNQEIILQINKQYFKKTIQPNDPLWDITF